MVSTYSIWLALGAWIWGTAAFCCAVAAVWLWRRGKRYGTARAALAIALGATALWGLIGTFGGSEGAAEELAEALRNLAWLIALYRLFAIDGRIAKVQPVRPILMVLGFVAVMQACSQVLLFSFRPDVALSDIAYHTSILLRLLFITGSLVLVHNLYVGATNAGRLALRWPGLALVGIWAFDLNYFTIGYLAGSPPMGLGALRGLTAMAAALFLVVGARKGSEGLRFSPSRSVTFQSISLLLIGAYLVSMVAVAQWLSYSGEDFAVTLQLAFIVGATVLAGAVVPSRRARSWLRVVLAKHLFQHRYDYRAEWLRFTRTISEKQAGAASFEERTIRAVADMTDSPAGLLLTEADGGDLELAARWNWPTAEVPACALPAASRRFFEERNYIADFDVLRSGNGQAEAEARDAVPAWLLQETRAWALVPLLHFERLVGMVVLARPLHARRLDWEDFDLLRVAGQQLASYIAERAGQSALAEAARFDDFHRRIAFVMHDIKNLASQLSLLARNAEAHSENPEFRADMLITLRNSADKLNALLSRLSRYGTAQVEALETVAADAVARSVVDRFRSQHPVELIESVPSHVDARRETLEQVLVHLVQNAIDASAPDSPVFVRVGHEGLNGVVEVVDSGEGMSAEFIRTRLFKPFDSSKPGGFGIGAYEARELVAAMQGRLEVESREGLGTRFVIRLPLSPAAGLKPEQCGRKVA